MTQPWLCFPSSLCVGCSFYRIPRIQVRLREARSLAQGHKIIRKVVKSYTLPHNAVSTFCLGIWDMRQLKGAPEIRQVWQS